MAGHTSEEIAAFTNGDERMLWAADRVTRRVFYLHDGDAERFRAHTRENLVCVVPDCPTPTITVVARRGNRRQGFRHHIKVPGEGHAMGLFHIQGQAQIQAWLTIKYERSTVALEVPINDKRDRVADVMMTAERGQRVAFEVQYASLNAAKWEERHADYKLAGIPDVWLFGHTGSQLKLDRDKNVKLNATHRVAAQNGLHLLWFNPLDQMLATVTVPRFFPVSGRTVAVPVYGAGGSDAELPAAILHLFPLADAHVTAKGLTASVLLGLESCLAEALELEAAAIVQKAADDAAAIVRKAAAVAAAAAARDKLEIDDIRRVANRNAKMERMRGSHDKRKLAWPDHPLRRSILDQFDGVWPKFLDVEPIGERKHERMPILMPFPHQQWEAALYTRFINRKGDRSSVRITDCTAHLLALDSDIPLAKEAVAMWFHRLLDFGVLEKETVRWRDGSDGVRYVTRDPKAKQADLEAEASLRAEEDERSRVQLAAFEFARNEKTRIAAEEVSKVRLVYETWTDTALSVADLAAAGTPVKALPAAIAGKNHCYNCYRSLSNQVEVSRGYHRQCTEGIYRSVGRPFPPKPKDYYD